VNFRFASGSVRRQRQPIFDLARHHVRPRRIPGQIPIKRDQPVQRCAGLVPRPPRPTPPAFRSSPEPAATQPQSDGREAGVVSLSQMQTTAWRRSRNSIFFRRPSSTSLITQASVGSRRRLRPLIGSRLVKRFERAAERVPRNTAAAVDVIEARTGHLRTGGDAHVAAAGRSSDMHDRTGTRSFFAPPISPREVCHAPNRIVVCCDVPRCHGIRMLRPRFLEQQRQSQLRSRSRARLDLESRRFLLPMRERPGRAIESKRPLGADRFVAHAVTSAIGTGVQSAGHSHRVRIEPSTTKMAAMIGFLDVAVRSSTSSPETMPPAGIRTNTGNSVPRPQRSGS
jgi:hypothetical protein